MLFIWFCSFFVVSFNLNGKLFTLKILPCFNHREFIHVTEEEPLVNIGPYFQQLIFHWQVFTLIIFYADMQLWVMFLVWLFSLVFSLVLTWANSGHFILYRLKVMKTFCGGLMSERRMMKLQPGDRSSWIGNPVYVFFFFVFSYQPKNWKFIWRKWITFQNLDSLPHLSFAITFFLFLMGFEITIRVKSLAAAFLFSFSFSFSTQEWMLNFVL